MARRPIPPFETEITHLGPKGIGVGTAPDGREVFVRGAPVGARVAVQVFKRKKGALHARRTAMIRPPASYTTPPCPIFGLCGGCVLQEMSLEAQRAAKHARVVHDVLGDAVGDVQVHAPRGADAAYGYRNKVELSFGVKRYLSEADQAAGLPHGGRFLGFHAPGRFDRVVDAERCELVSDALNAVLAVVRSATLHADASPLYDPHRHAGGWRHLILRQGMATGQILVGLITTSEVPEAEVDALATAIHAAELPDGCRVVGVRWEVHDGVADVARGDHARTWGDDHLEERLGGVTYRLSMRAFFQTSTAGAQVLYDTVGDAVGAGGTLLDLYCGTGAIGLHLADRVDRVVGFEEVPEAVHDARANAAAHGLDATYQAVKVEDALAEIAAIPGPRRLVVDPPRVGLHPKAAAAMAEADADVLVYVACHPPSLGRDREILEAGGWVLTDLWTVDLFPQTGHVEAIARFERRST